MTQAEWLECTDPQKMLDFLKGKASDRKLRLFAAACGRRIWHLLTDQWSRAGVEVAEQFADGLVQPDMVQQARERAWMVREEKGNAVGLVPVEEMDTYWTKSAESDAARVAWLVTGRPKDMTQRTAVASTWSE
jgi:hypothetical protein